MKYNWVLFFSAVAFSGVFAQAGDPSSQVSCGETRTITRTGLDVQIGSGGGCDALEQNKPDVIATMIQHAQYDGASQVVARLQQFDADCKASVGGTATPDTSSGDFGSLPFQYGDPQFGAPVINLTDNCNVTVDVTLTQTCECN